jgi:ADP-heptose:LPS heptosyltransferase
MNMGKLGGIEPEKVVIFKALLLGDTLCAVPAFRALRKALPNTSITLVGLPWARGFVQRYHYLLDDFVEFPGLPGLPERPPRLGAFPTFLEYIQDQRFDLALQMQGSGHLSNSLVTLFAARHTAGFYLPGDYCPDEHLFLPYPAGDHEIWRHLRLIEHLGLPLDGDHLEFPLYQEDWQALYGLSESHRFISGSYAVLHPGARDEQRRWPVERFSMVADAMAQRGLQIVLTGTSKEAELVERVRQGMHYPAVNLAGRTPLGAMAALLKGARLLVSNDTGISHLSAALHVPSVILFMTSEPHRWAPLDLRLHRAITWGRRASATEVIAAAEEMLQQEVDYAR